MSIALAVAGARRSYGNVTALKDVSFELHAGELLGLLGPNGAGKSTLIRAICGRVQLDGGSVLLHDTAAKSRRDTRLIGYVPQDLAIYPELTARENLQVFGRLHGVVGRNLKHRVRKALKWSDLTDQAEVPVGQFSGGMKRRVNIACGVLHRPPVVLLDEPTVGVDPQSRERIFEMLQELRDRGTAILLTTHQLDDVEKFCDRIVIIDHGRVIAEGTMLELIAGTVGTERRVVFRLDRPLSEPLPGFSGREHSALVEASISSVIDDLPRCLHTLRDAGYEVLDAEIHSPNLQSVFIHLTGRELRE